jgi:predicted lipid carrier protein YhbT
MLQALRSVLVNLPPFPRALRALVARLPAYPPAAAAAFLSNLLLGDTLGAGNLPAARGKVIAVHVRDTGLRLAFAVQDGGLVPLGNVQADATISADARDFIALALRAEDPDTLFFSRRLTLEGDTELALQVKNTLDGVDLRTLRLPTPARVLSALRLQTRAFF